MTSRDFMPADEIRADFSRAMSEMHRHMRSVGHERAVGVEDLSLIHI